MLDEFIELPSWSVVSVKRGFEGALFSHFFLLLFLKLIKFGLFLLLLLGDRLTNIFLPFFVLLDFLIFLIL